MGRRQIGIRYEGAQETPRPRRWELKRAPKWWSADTVRAGLESLGFTDIGVGSRVWNGNHADWMVKATPAPHRGRDDGKGASPDKEAGKGKDHPAPAAIGDDIEMDGDKGGQKKGKIEKAVTKRKIPDQYELVNIDGDGDCMYAAIAIAKSDIYQKRRPSAKQVRAGLSTWLNNHSEGIKELWDGRNSKGVECSWQEYLDEQKRMGVWGGRLELEAAAWKWKMTSWLSAPEPQKRDTHLRQKKSPALRRRQKGAVALWYTGDHYDYLRLKEGGKARGRALRRRRRRDRLLGGVAHHSRSAPRRRASARAARRGRAQR